MPSHKNHIDLFFFGVLIIFSLNSCTNDQKKVEKYIIEGESQWAESVAGNDTSVLQRIIADDCIWILDGKRWDKKMAIADAKAGPGDFIADHLDKAEVRFFGNTAVVAGSETWTRKRKDGTTFQGQFVWTDTWVNRNDNWQIVQAEDITLTAQEK
jgi:ketosteroid isomerase-like protein